MQRREDIYPSKESGFPDHLTFVPERWETWTPRPFTYIPFNGGPRICIGQQFALTEMAYTIVRILQTYSKVESRNDSFPGLRSDIVLQPQKGETSLSCCCIKFSTADSVCQAYMSLSARSNHDSIFDSPSIEEVRITELCK